MGTMERSDIIGENGVNGPAASPHSTEHAGIDRERQHPL